MKHLFNSKLDLVPLAFPTGGEVMLVKDGPGQVFTEPVYRFDGQFWIARKQDDFRGKIQFATNVVAAGGIIDLTEDAAGRLIGKVETIVCSAILFDDGQARQHSPSPTGLVLAGLRHHNCLALAQQIDLDWKAKGLKPHQGFITSLNRFVDRTEAMQLALAAGQLLPTGKDELYSEDLW